MGFTLESYEAKEALAPNVYYFNIGTTLLAFTTEC
jgi:hypothetical protein